MRFNYIYTGETVTDTLVTTEDIEAAVKYLQTGNCLIMLVFHMMPCLVYLIVITVCDSNSCSFHCFVTCCKTCATGMSYINGYLLI